MLIGFKVRVWSLFTLILLCKAYSHAQENAITKFYYENGNVSSEGIIADGIPDGFWISYYLDGTLKSKGIRKNGLLDSVWNFYNKEGLIKEKINYLDGKKNGYYYSFIYENNKDSISIKYLKSEELYLNNIRHGISNYFWNNGTLHQSILFEKGLKSGTTREFDPTGRLISIREFRKGKEVDFQAINRLKDGLKFGIWKEFYPNGKIKKEMNYLNGTLTGLVRSYDLSGDLIKAQRFEKDIIIDSLVEIGNTIDVKEEFYSKLDDYGEPIKKFSGGFIEGIPIGIHRNYDSLGRVTSSKLYNKDGFLIGKGIVDDEGNKVGEWNFFYADGKIKSKGFYKNNRRIDRWQYFYPTGSLEQEGIFTLGRPSGKWLWYFKNGNIKREEYYHKGKENGISIEYDFNTNIVVKGEYINGLKQGEWFYNFVTHNEIGSYDAGNRVGLWLYKYNNGTLYFEGKFNQGYEEGKHIYYYKNKKIKEKRLYISGLKIKNWEYYDYYGSLIKVLTFDNDKLIKIDGVSVQM